jgi:hypothetical protein
MPKIGVFMTYLFLSYAKTDRKSADSIKTLLEKTGGAVWMDENPRELTEQQWPIIEANILKAAAFVLLVSEDAKKSNWLQRELVYAESIQKPIFPILISGTDWPRLFVPAETLEFGLSLDLPDSLKEKLKALGLNPLSAELPPQIPSHTIDYKRGRVKKSFALWLGIMAAMIAILFIFAPLLIGLINRGEANFASTPSPQPSPWEMTQNSEATQTQQAERESSSERPRDTYRQTQTQERRDLNRIERNMTRTSEAIHSTQEVVWVQESVRQNALMQRSATPDSQPSETPYIGIGQIPCDATAVMENGISNVTLYSNPSLEAGTGQLTRSGGEGQAFVITAWVVNDDGSWYRVGTSASSFMGYVLAEELILDESCPR